MQGNLSSSDGVSAEEKILDGVPLRVPNGFYWTFAIICLGIAVVAYQFTDRPRVSRRTDAALATVVFGCIGVMMLLFAGSGRSARYFIWFEEGGITFRHGSWWCTVPWQSVVRVDFGRADGKRHFRLHVEDIGALPIQPPEYREAALRRIQRTVARAGAPFVIRPVAYYRSPAAFVEAFARHGLKVRDAAAPPAAS